MSRSLLYQAFGVRGYQHVSTEHYQGALYFSIDQRQEGLCCSACGSHDVTRKGKVVRYFRSVPIGDKPVFVLTSNRTFSAAEEFTYNLKHLKRATIVGETTGGGAHPVTSYGVNKYFTLRVPYARAVNPITKTNWEGVGVIPHVATSAADALDRAADLARTPSVADAQN